MEVKKMSFVAACREFFGFREGTGLKDFSAELKALTDKDRVELKAEFAKIGYEITN